MAVSRRIALAIAAAISTVAMAAIALGDQGPAPAPPAAAVLNRDPGALIEAQVEAQVEAQIEAPVAAFRRGDLDETTRLLQRAGREVVAAALGASRTSALAAMWAVQERGEPWPLLQLAAAAGSADRRRALAAAQAALTIATRLELESAEAEDLDGETLTGWQADWLAVARRADTWIDVRSDSLEVAVLLGRIAAALEPAAAKPGEDALSGALLALLADEDPAMRRAALELLGTPLPRPTREEVARLIVSEAEPAVARAAAAALCAELGGRVAGDVMGALGTEGMSRLRELAKATTVAVASDVELARCLAADGRAESRAALRALMQVAPGPLRKAMVSVERGAR